MKPSFLCYIEGRDSRWQGVCVDLDLSGTGRSAEDVKARLHHVIETYIADAMAEDEPHRSRLLSRRSPWRTRAFWRSHVAAARLGHRLGKAAATTAIRLPAASCPV